MLIISVVISTTDVVTIALYSGHSCICSGCCCKVIRCCRSGCSHCWAWWGDIFFSITTWILLNFFSGWVTSPDLQDCTHSKKTYNWRSLVNIPNNEILGTQQLQGWCKLDMWKIIKFFLSPKGKSKSSVEPRGLCTLIKIENPAQRSWSLSNWKL